VDPTTGDIVNAKVGEGAYGNGGVQVVEEVGDVKEEDHPNHAHLPGFLDFAA